MIKHTTKAFPEKFILYLLLKLLILIMLSGCASAPPKEDDFRGFSDIKAGDDALLKWVFNDAEKVRVEGYNKDFAPVDSINVSPPKSTKYNIISYASSGDSTINTWRVYVRGEVTPQEPQRGPVILTGKDLSPSIEESSYFTGIIQYADGINAKQVKVMRTEYPTLSAPKYTLNVILLDQFGNYITGMKPGKDSQFNAATFCVDTSTTKINLNFEEKLYTSDDPSLGISVELDNSAAAEQNSSVFNQLKEFTSGLDESDKLSFTYFNHNSFRIFENQYAEKAYLRLGITDLPQPSGLNAMYKAVYNCLLSQSKSSNQGKNVNIIITYGNDNSSLIYTLKDVADLARKQSIPLYVLGIGNSIESYELKYLASATGGRFYYVSEDEISSVKEILKEIALSHKTFYQLSLPEGKIPSDCSIIRGELTYSSENKTLSDKLRLIANPSDQYSKYQSICAFGFKDATINTEFDDNITLLGKILKDNPPYAIQLIGHTGIEGNEEYNNKLGLKRAEIIQKRLLDLGVSPSQIRSRSEGGNMPLYFIQSLGWQQYFNRRVELRWLDPDLLPFEIIAGTYNSEEEAQKKSDEWQNRGFRSYYQRYLQNNTPVYRIKLWGFKTYTDAMSAAQKLEKEFKISFKIE